MLLLAITLVSVTVAGRVEASSARWRDAETIVTESRLRLDDGSVVRVLQLGGVVDGIGMRYSHVPPVLQAGTDVELVVTEGARRSVLAVRDRRGAFGAGGRAAPGAVAASGVQRTALSGAALYRASSRVRFAVDAAGSATIPGDLELAALDAALEEWNAATTSCAGFGFAREVGPDAPHGRDGVDSVHFLDDRWCRPATATEPEVCYPVGTAAVTRLVFVDNPHAPDDGRILEADIALNAVDHAFAVDGPYAPASGALDLASVITHELGHALGLDHTCTLDGEAATTDLDGRPVPSCGAADAEHLAATMYVAVPPGDTSKRSLEPADTAAACALLDPAGVGAEVTGACSAAGSSSSWLAVGLLPLWRRRRRRPHRPAA